MAHRKLAGRIAATLVILFLVEPAAQADGGCAGRVVSISGGAWAIGAGGRKPLRAGDCVRISDRVKTGEGASGVIRMIGFGDLGLGNATEIRVDEHYAHPSRRNLSVLSVELLAGTARYASDFFAPPAAATIMVAGFRSSIRVADAAVRVTLRAGRATLEITRGRVRLAGADGARLEFTAPARVSAVPGGRWEQRRNPEEIPCSRAENDAVLSMELPSC